MKTAALYLIFLAILVGLVAIDQDLQKISDYLGVIARVQSSR